MCDPVFRVSNLDVEVAPTYADVVITRCRTHQGTFISEIFECRESDKEIELTTCTECMMVNSAALNALRDCEFCGGCPVLDKVSEP